MAREPLYHTTPLVQNYAVRPSDKGPEVKNWRPGNKALLEARINKLVVMEGEISLVSPHKSLGLPISHKMIRSPF